MSNEIRGIMIPVTDEKKILLPNAIIAEVVSIKELTEMEDSPLWLLGSIDWRGYQIPVVDYEVLVTNKKIVDNNKSNRVAIIKSLTNDADLPYFALISNGVPRLQLITQGDLQVHENEGNESNAIASKVTIQDELTEIPNIRYIVHSLLDL
jgi:chemosensory pili system protein ChpC